MYDEIVGQSNLSRGVERTGRHERRRARMKNDLMEDAFQSV